MDDEVPTSFRVLAGLESERKGDEERVEQQETFDKRLQEIQQETADSMDGAFVRLASLCLARVAASSVVAPTFVL